MKKILIFLLLLQALSVTASSKEIEVNNKLKNKVKKIEQRKNQLYSLVLKVDKLRNSKGIVRFFLYNRDKTIPDRRFKKFYKKQTGNISNKSSQTTFNNLPKGRYAVIVLHDENKNGRLDKGLFLPVEGIGASNYSSIGIRHRPNYRKASFELNSDTEKTVKLNYF